MKEIDWEERHFQICLAMLSCPVCNRHGQTDAPYEKDVIVRADKMVELLKKHYLKKENVEESSADSTPDPLSEVSVEKKYRKGISWKKEFEQMRVFAELWKALENYGFSKGDDIPFLQFYACCDELNIELDEDEVDKFTAKYDVNIG